MRKKKQKTHKCNETVSLFIDSNRSDDNYNYSIEKLMQQC